MMLASSYELKPDLTQIPFTLVKDLLIVEATINGETGNFIFDTGAAGLTLNWNHFKEESWKPEGKFIIDISGVNRHPHEMNVQEFQLGHLTRHRFNVPVIDHSVLEEGLDLPLFGLIGYDILEAFEIVFDYYDSVIYLVKLDKKGHALVDLSQTIPDYTFEISIENFLPILHSNLEDNPLRLALDSGAALNLIDTRFEKYLGAKAVQTRYAQIGGAFSAVKEVKICTYPSIIIDGQLAVKWWRAAFNDLSHLRKKQLHIDGIIGVKFFQFGKVALNYKRKMLRVWTDDQALSGKYFNASGR